MLKYLVIIEKTKSGFSAYVPDLPGCVATGKTKKMVERNIYEAVKFHIEGLREDKLEIPKPSTESEVFVFAA
jgi:predicted RNase H-like HicB family nuclease